MLDLTRNVKITLNLCLCIIQFIIFFKKKIHINRKSTAYIIYVVFRYAFALNKLSRFLFSYIRAEKILLMHMIFDILPTLCSCKLLIVILVIIIIEE